MGVTIAALCYSRIGSECLDVSALVLVHFFRAFVCVFTGSGPGLRFSAYICMHTLHTYTMVYTCTPSLPLRVTSRDPYTRPRLDAKPSDCISTTHIHPTVTEDSDERYVRPIFPLQDAIHTINKVHPHQLHFGSPGGGGGVGGVVRL